jgi:septum formation protein
MNIFDEEIWLASKSPRRLQLLQESGFKVKVVPIDVEEEWDDNMPYNKVAAYLAELKGAAAFQEYGPDQVLITADSVVVASDRLLEKPGDISEAHEMLSLLSNRTHKVYTGFCIQHKGQKFLETVMSIVHMDDISNAERSYYIDEFKPFDKAGSYGIQEWMGHCKINKIEGSYTNIMGLPMREVYRALHTIITS